MGGYKQYPPSVLLECSLEKEALSELLDKAVEAIRVLRRDGARVHSITNTVAQNFTANVLLACNTKPSMTVNPDEVETFISRADALHINLGTLDAGRIEAINKSVLKANQSSIPILLDPVMVHVSPSRAEFAGKIMDKVNIIRGNKSEIQTLGIEHEASPCIVMTGQCDKIFFKEASLNIQNGHPIMSNVIATGCALGALITALSSKTDCPVCASLAGLLWFGIAGEMAAQKHKNPGSFSPAFIDSLYEVDLDTLHDKAKLS